MKKYFIILFTIILCGFIFLNSIKAGANNTEVNRNDIRALNGYLRSKIRFWQKLHDCTPYKTEILMQQFEIIEKVDHSCHVIIQGTECYYPMDVASKYAYNAENMLRKIIDDLTTKEQVNQEDIDEEGQYIKRINYQYCNVNQYRY